MGTFFVDQIKKQASSFLQEKCKSARLVFTDVTLAELLAEDVTNNDPTSPDARTMSKIAQASLDIDDYWRIACVLHRRLDNFDWKQWRTLYKSLVLLDFLITHGSEDFAREFRCQYAVIQELGEFKHKDEKGFDWGMSMKQKSERIVELLQGGEKLKQARLKALKVTKEIRGFGNQMFSPSSSSSSSTSCSDMSGNSSFGSYCTSSPPWYEANTWEDISPNTEPLMESPSPLGMPRKNVQGLHVWNRSPAADQKDTLLLSCEDEPEKQLLEVKGNPNGLKGTGVCSKLVGFRSSMSSGPKSIYRSVSDAGKVGRKKMSPKFSREH